MLALLLFVTVAVTVSSVVHLAARPAGAGGPQRRRGRVPCSGWPQTVLGGADTPTAVLAHLTSAWGGRAELAERVRDQWVSVAVSGSAPPAAVPIQVPVSDTVALIIAGQTRAITARLLDGFAAQAGRGAGPGPAAHPGRPGRGAGRGEPDAHRAARRGQPRPAYPAGLDQGQRQHAAADRRAVDRGPTRRRCSRPSRTGRTGWTP